ncbi:MAG: M14 family zinc carboxypeptidase [Phycisphaeraceae bacterium]
MPSPTEVKSRHASNTRPVPPTTEDVQRRLADLARREPDRVHVRTVERSGEGRPIDAVTVTDPSISDSLKQHVLLVAGQHGNEESARLVALELLDHLLADAQRDTLRRQKIVVIPNVNPDGAINDTYETPGGIKPNMDHGPAGSTTPEGRAVECIASEMCPDVFVDIHARGHAGCSYDMVLYPQTKAYTEDDNLFHEIAAEMIAAGERAGLPHITHPLAWWVEPSDDASSTTAYAYGNFKSIVMLTESAEGNEHAYPQALTARVGVARIMALLAWGDRKHPKLYYAGYPNGLVLGMFSTALMAAGETPAARRRSRVAIWQQRDAFRSLNARLPERRDHKTVVAEYAGPTLHHGVGLMLRAAGHREVAEVRCRGRELRPSEVDGYYTYRDATSTYVVAVLPTLEAGAWDVEAVLR